jgi:glycosyltransferase A (GT-A) superfamily protein (DUF2064 family)
MHATLYLIAFTFTPTYINLSYVYQAAVCLSSCQRKDGLNIRSWMVPQLKIIDRITDLAYEKSYKEPSKITTPHLTLRDSKLSLIHMSVVC